jgi:predicted Holliday junction resolvase-like endonuclease
MCPECGGISRLGDLQLRTVEKAPRTWLDDYDLKVEKADEQEAKFEEEEEEIREKARERGRAQVPHLIRKAMGTQFAKLNYNPYDIKALLHPVDLVVFDGMTEQEMKNVVFLSKSNPSQYLQTLQNGVVKSINNKAYDWKVVRVSQDGQVEIE